MNASQNLWTTILTVGPALYLGIKVAWWLGILAYLIIAVLNIGLGWLSVTTLPPQWLGIAGYIKMVSIAVLVVSAGLLVGTHFGLV